MTGTDFADSNVLVYAYNLHDARKYKIAQDIVRKALTGAVVISAQVLAEFSAVVLHKWKPGLKPKDLLAVLDGLGSIPVVRTDAEMVRRAVEARLRYGIHFYDGMIIAAAERAGCQRIWSEDFHAGQSYFGIAVEDPFV